MLFPLPLDPLALSRASRFRTLRCDQGSALDPLRGPVPSEPLHSFPLDTVLHRCGIQLFGVVLAKYDRRSVLSKEIVLEISEHFPKERFETIIPLSVRLKEAPWYGKDILEHDPRSPGALAYKQLAEEVIARTEQMLG